MFRAITERWRDMVSQTGGMVSIDVDVIHDPAFYGRAVGPPRFPHEKSEYADTELSKRFRMIQFINATGLRQSQSHDHLAVLGLPPPTDSSSDDAPFDHTTVWTKGRRQIVSTEPYDAETNLPAFRAFARKHDLRVAVLPEQGVWSPGRGGTSLILLARPIDWTLAEVDALAASIDLKVSVSPVFVRSWSNNDVLVQGDKCI